MSYPPSSSPTNRLRLVRGYSPKTPDFEILHINRQFKKMKIEPPRVLRFAKTFLFT